MATVSSTFETTPQVDYSNTYNIGARIPHTIEFWPRGKTEFWTMHPRRYEMHDTLLLYSYLDGEMYTALEWKYVLYNRLLWAGPRESLFDVKAKIQLATWSPTTKLVIKKVISSVYGSRCVRATETPELAEWIKNVDGLGKSLKQFSRISTRRALIYGTSYTLVELPEGLKPDVESLEDQQDFRAPILTNFNGLELINWRLDDNGELDYAMFVKMVWGDGEDQGYRCWRWWIVDKNQIRIYQARQGINSDPAEITNANHGLGFVPVVVHYGVEMEQPMCGTSIAEDTIDLDIQKFRADTNLSWMSYQAIHAQMVVKSKAADLGDVALSSSKYIKLKSGTDESVDMLSVDKGAFELGEAMSDKWKKDIGTASQFDPMMDADKSGTMAASSLARQMSHNQSLGQALRQHADMISEYETRLLRMVYKIMEGQDCVDVSVTYPDDYSASGYDVASETYLAMKDVIKSKSWHEHQRSLIMSATNGNLDDLNEKCRLEEAAALELEIEDPIDAILQKQELSEEDKRLVMEHFGVESVEDLEDAAVVSQD